MPAFGIAPFGSRLDPSRYIAAQAAAMGIRAPTGLLADRDAYYRGLAEGIAKGAGSGGFTRLGKDLAGAALDITQTRAPLDYVKQRLGYELSRVGPHGPVGPSYTDAAPAKLGEKVVANRFGMSVPEYRTYVDRLKNVELGAQTAVQTIGTTEGIGAFGMMFPRAVLAGLGAAAVGPTVKRVAPQQGGLSQIDAEAQALAKEDAETIGFLDRLPNPAGARNGFSPFERARWVRIARRRGIAVEDIRKMSDYQLKEAGLHGKTSGWDAVKNIPVSLINNLVGAPQGIGYGIGAGIESAKTGSPRPIAKFAKQAFLDPVAKFVDHPLAYAKEDPVGAGLIFTLGLRGGLKGGFAGTSAVAGRYAEASPRAAKIAQATATPRHLPGENLRVVTRKTPDITLTREGQQVKQFTPLSLGRIPSDPLYRGAQNAIAGLITRESARPFYDFMVRRQAKELGGMGSRTGGLVGALAYAQVQREFNHLPPARQLRLWHDVQNRPDATAPQRIEDTADFHREMSDYYAGRAEKFRAQLDKQRAELTSEGAPPAQVRAETQRLEAKIAREEEKANSNHYQAELHDAAAETPEFTPTEIEHYRTLLEGGQGMTESALGEAGYKPDVLRRRKSLETRTRDPGMRDIADTITTAEKRKRAKDLARARSITRKLRVKRANALKRAEIEQRKGNQLEANRWRREAHQAHETLIGVESQRRARERAEGRLTDAERIRDVGYHVGPKVEHHLVGEDIHEGGGRYGAREAARDRALLGQYVLLEDGRVGKVVDSDRTGVGVIAVERADGKLEHITRHFRGKTGTAPSIARMAERLRVKQGSRKGVETFPRTTEGKRVPQQKLHVIGKDEPPAPPEPARQAQPELQAAALEQPTIRVKISPSTKAAWAEDEYGAYEDYQRDPNSQRYASGTHPYEILTRGPKGYIEGTPAEIRDLIESGRYHGDVGGWDAGSRTAYRNAVNRTTQKMRDELEALPEPETAKAPKADEPGVPDEAEPAATGTTVWEITPNIVIYKDVDTAWTPPQTLTKAPEEYAQPVRWTIGVKASEGVYPLHEVTGGDFLGFDSAGQASAFVREELPAGVHLTDPGAPAMLAETADAYHAARQPGDLADDAAIDEALTGGGKTPAFAEASSPNDMRSQRRTVEELYAKADRAERRPLELDHTPTPEEVALMEERDRLRGESRQEFRDRVKESVIQAQLESMLDRGIEPVVYTPHRAKRPIGAPGRGQALGTGKPTTNLNEVIGKGRRKQNKAKLLLGGALDTSSDLIFREAIRPLQARAYVNSVRALAEEYGLPITSLDQITPEMEAANYVLDLDRVGGMLTKHGVQAAFAETLDAMLTDQGASRKQLDVTLGIREPIKRDKDGNPEAAEPGNYVLMPRHVVDSFQKGFQKSGLPRGLGAAGTMTDLFRYTQLHMRPGYSVANVATAGWFGAQSGALFNPRAIRHALRTEEVGRSGELRYPAAVGQTASNAAIGGPRVRPNPNAEGGGLVHRIGTKEGTGELKTPLKPIARAVEWMNVSASRFEQFMQKAIYHHQAHKSYASEALIKEAAKTEQGYMKFLEENAKRENIKPNDLNFLFDMAGKFSTHRNELAALIVPFYRWYSSMLRMTFWSLPVKHPGRAFILHSLAKQGEKISDERGQSLYDDLQNAIALGVGDWYLDLSAISPYAVASQLAGEHLSPLQTAGASFNPAITNVLDTLTGFSTKDWDSYENAEGQTISVLGGHQRGDVPSEHMLRDRALMGLGRGVRMFTPWSYQLQPQNSKPDTYVPFANLLPGVEQGSRFYATPKNLRRPEPPGRLKVPLLGTINPLGALGINLRRAPLEGDVYKAAFLGELGAEYGEPGMTSGGVLAAQRARQNLVRQNRNPAEAADYAVRKMQEKQAKLSEKGVDLVPYGPDDEPITWDEMRRLPADDLPYVYLDEPE